MNRSMDVLNIIEKVFGRDWFSLNPTEQSRRHVSSDQSWTLQTGSDIALITAFALLTFYFGGIWHLGSDDTGYIGAARQWLHQFPYVSTFFGDLRHTVILPIAASILLFGDTEVTVAVPTILFGLGTIAITYLFLKEMVDRTAGLLGAVLLSASPVFTESSTTPSADMCELFFVAASLLTFLRAVSRNLSLAHYFASGLLASFAFMTRESSIALLALYGILFAANFGGNRRIFFMMGAGFAAVFLSEMLLYWLAAGDPFFRMKLVAAASQKPDPKVVSGVLDFGYLGVFNVSKFLDPFLFAIAHPKFILVFPLAIAALTWSTFLTSAQSTNSRIIRHFFCLGLLSFLVAGFVLSYLAPLTRYFMVSYYCMLMATVLWIHSGFGTSKSVAAITITVLILLGSLISTDLTNRSPRFAERTLAALAQEPPEVITTDVETLFRGRFLYEWTGVTSRIKAGRPLPGTLFFQNPKYDGLTNARTKDVDIANYKPQAGWTLIRTIEEPDTMTLTVLRTIGITNLLPHGLVKRMQGNPPVKLYRTANGSS